MHWGDLFNSVGSLFVVATASTKTMVPLRILGIIANCFLLTYYGLSHLWVPMGLQFVALPLNGYRLHQMLRLIRNVRGAIRGNDSMDWLKPFMTKRHCRAGDVLFAKDAVADEMFYTLSGRYRLTEMNIDIPPGQIIGELGMLAPSNRRTASFECIQDGVLLTVTYQQVKELYFQNPEFGFYFLRLATARLFDNIARLQTQVEQLRPAHA